MATVELRQELEGISEAKRGNTMLGLKLLSGSKNPFRLPKVKAWHGYCLAREKKDFRNGISLCEEALLKEPNNSDIYLALGRIYLFAGLRGPAIKTLQEGLRIDHNKEIYRLLSSVGMRKSPAFSFLGRENRLNIVTGRLLSWVGFR
jgi:tetratricopeptide (TPR) repeat protein